MCYLLGLLTAVAIYGTMYVLMKLGFVDLSRFDTREQPPAQE